MAESVNYIIQIRDRFSRKLTGFRDKLKGVGRTAKDEAKQIEKFNKKINSLAKRGLAALGAAATVSSITFANFSKGLQNVKGLLSSAEVEKYGEALENAAKSAIKLGFDIPDVSRALFTTISSLGASEKSLEVFRKAQELAIAGNAELSTSVEGLTSIVNAYGRETADANEVANALFTGQVKGNTDVTRLSNSLGRVSPIAKSAGVGFKELIAVVSALTLGGISTDEAVTGLKGGLISLIKPSKEAETILKALGVPVGLTQVRTAGLSKAFADLIKVERKHPDLIARAIPNQEGLNTVLAMTDDKLKMVQEAMEKINKDIKTGTGLHQKFGDQLGEQAQAWRMLTGSVKVFFIEIGRILSPIVIKTFTFLTSEITKLNNALAKVKDFSWENNKEKVKKAFFRSFIGPEPEALDAFNKGSAMMRSFRKFRQRGALDNLDKTSEMKNLLKTSQLNTQSVDISGSLNVRADKGTTVTRGEMFNPNIGLNIATAGALS